MKRLFAFLLALILLMAPVVAQATDFISWDTDVYLDEEGHAHITTRWVSDEDRGTEKYIVIENLKKDMVLRDFKVKDERGEYENIGKWDVDASRMEKEQKCGIVKNGNGYELCWGFGTYERHEYEFSYVIENMVQNLKDDYQILFFTFLNPGMSEYPDTMTLKIHAAEPFGEDVKMWAYGFPGEIHLVDGAIDVKSDGFLGFKTYVTVLLRFEPESFKATGRINKSFDKILKKANEGSDYNSGGTERMDTVATILAVVFIVAFFILPVGFLIFWIIFHIIRFFKKRLRLRKYRHTYYRDIPYDGSWEELYAYFDENGRNAQENYITAYFLKWIHEGIFDPVYREKSLGRKEYGFRIHYVPEEQLWPAEVFLYRNFTAMAEDGEIITDSMMRRYFRSHNYYFMRFIGTMETESKEALENQNYMVTRKRFFQTVLNLTEKGKELEARLMGFKNYLEDYSLLEEREAYSVHLWENYMIWAAIYGITDEVEKQFRKLYPQVQDNSMLMSAAVVTFTRDFSHRVNAVGMPKSSGSSSRSSGGGGSSSSGGGGGSFGGGSGGGTR